MICLLSLTVGCQQNNKEPFTQNDLIYFIMTDRFNDADESNNDFYDVDKKNPKAYHGGDLKGITEKLDYIKSLGTTAIWLTPIMDNQDYGYHGYWIDDFYKVDPHLGTLSDFKLLVKEAHKRDIKVILDYIVNHTSYKSPWLKDSEKKEWFHPHKDISSWTSQEEIENGWLSGLPDLNQENPEVKKYLIENALWWIEETDIDGMRLDTVRHVPKEFWTDFTSAIKKKHPNFYFLGEVWSDNPRYLELYHQTGIDGLTNYSLYQGIHGTFRGFAKTNSLVNALKKESYFSDPTINGIFLDNHDNRRFISDAGEHGEEYLKQALTFMMTYPAIPVIYYGTEIGMEGGADPDNRRDMEWDRINNSDILEFYNKLVELRNTNIALKGNDFELLDYDSKYISYIRRNENDSVIVIMNILNKEKEVTVNIPTDIKQYTDILTDTTYDINNSKLNLRLKPLDIIILKQK